jgi:CheY-like chemotaxis protein
VVLDRDADTRGVVAATVRVAGAETLEASSVEEALAHCAQLPPDVILADLTHPDADGHVLVDKLRATGDDTLSHVPVLAITGYAHDPDRVQTETNGLRARLDQPVTPESLVNNVARARSVR